MSRNPIGLVLTLTFLLVTSEGRGDDWPQWMGPKRDNIWRETGILEKFPVGGPKILWKTAVAGGYSGPAVADGKVVVTDYVTKDNVKVDNFDRSTFTGLERVLCLQEATGEILWKHQYPVTYTVSYPAGPRCTPNIDGDRVYTLGAEGHLICFKMADGAIVWEKDLKSAYKTKSALWGYASHPLIDDDKLICVVGTEEAHSAAFDKLTGKELWRAGKAPEQGYSPPTIIEAAHQRQLIFVKPDGVYAVNPETGRELWKAPYNADNGSIIMSPIQIGDYLFVGGYQEKNLLLKLDSNAPGAEVVWQNKPRQAISPVNVQPIASGNIIYGFHEKGDLRGFEVPSGEVLWRNGGPLGQRPQGSGTAFIVREGERYWMFTEQGDLVIAELSKTGYQEIDRAHLIEPSNFAFGRDVVWCAPAFANRKMYVRNDNQLISVSLAK